MISIRSITIQPFGYYMASVVITPSADSYAYLGRAIEHFNGGEQFRYDPGWHKVNGTGSGLATVRASWDDAEIALDVIGSTEIPILSQIADLGASAIALAQGDPTGAGLSALASLPIIGEVANGVKWGRRVSKVANAGKKLPFGVPSWKKAKVDWDHIFQRHSDWGKVGKQSGKKTIFEGLSEPQIRDVIKGAYQNVYSHSKSLRQEGISVLRGKFKGWNVEFYVNRNTKVIETAYPISK